MKTFATLIRDLESTNKTTLRMEAISRFLTGAEEEDKLWFLALFTGKRPRRNVRSTQIREWAVEEAGIPEWLFLESYAAVGDMGETISLILPEPDTKPDKDRNLAAWMRDIGALKNASDEEKKQFILRAWRSLPHTERFIFNKLIGGSFRVGISSQSLINALSRHYNIEASTVAHSIMGDWSTEEVTFEDLIRGRYTDTRTSRPYPFCLAYALDREPDTLGLPGEWQAEYKWDGIRSQLIRRNGEVYIWSRGEELITAQFPEIREALLQWEGDFVIDGELLAYRDSQVLDFSELQKRINRKTLSAKLLREIPAVVFAYDLLEWQQEDIRHLALRERRSLLESLVSRYPRGHIRLSPLIPYDDWDKLKEERGRSRDLHSEGLMLKQRDSPYHTGRKKGDWWKWKTDPFTIDAVMIYAQKGSGRRSAYYTDYTFAVRKGTELVTIAKAYSGLTDKEIQEVSRFVSRHAVEKFGPVRTVKPELVFEIAFEGISLSNRHKSGVALRFPRILRWRRDKPVAEIDDIEDIKKLIR